MLPVLAHSSLDKVPTPEQFDGMRARLGGVACVRFAVVDEAANVLFYDLEAVALPTVKLKAAAPAWCTDVASVVHQQS